MDFGVFKRHPYLTGGGILIGGVILFVVLKGSGGRTVTSMQTSSDPNQTALQVAQIQGNYALAQAKTVSDAQAHVADLAAAVATKQTDNSLTAALAQIQASLGLGNLQLQAQHDQLQFALDAQKDNNATSLAAANMNFQLQQQQNRNSFQVAELNYYNTQTAIRLADDQAAITRDQQFYIQNKTTDALIGALQTKAA